MENIKGRIKKQFGKELEPEIRAEGRSKVWNGDLMKYYAHNETAGSLDDLKRYGRFFNSEKTPGGNGDEQK